MICQNLNILQILPDISYEIGKRSASPRRRGEFAHSNVAHRLSAQESESIKNHKRIDTPIVYESTKKRNVIPENGLVEIDASRSLALSKPITTHVLAKSQLKNSDFTQYVMQNYPDNHLFQQFPNNFDCQICMKSGNVHVCSGKCGDFYHRECLAKVRNGSKDDASAIDLETGEDLRWPDNNCERCECATCLRLRKSQCFVCAKDTGLTGCSIKDCGYYYHLDCLEHWPQHNYTVKSMMCPRHVCHICIADDPRCNYRAEIDNELTKCLLCPATYHRKSICIPAGSELMSRSQMLCPRHCEGVKKPFNIDWCLFCGKVGSLINCKTCPTAIHQECLKSEHPDDNYTCIGCKTGRLPLYGEIVWAKYLNFEWWPAMLVNPSNVPEDVAIRKPGDNYMCIRFFGSYEFGWVCRGRVYLYQLEDTNLNQTKQNGKKFNTAIEEAFKWAKFIKEKYGEHKVLKNPPQYITIKTNRPLKPVQYEKKQNNVTDDLCNCLPTDENPCGPGNQCINYAASLECTANCSAGDRCQNQRFKKRICPKVKAKHFNAKGWGLIALENIPHNTFIIEYVGEVIDSNELKNRFDQLKEDKAENFYFMNLENGLYIDSAILGNEARFINHSCEPNCIAEKWIVDGQTRIGFFAATDIPKVGFRVESHSLSKMISSFNQQNTELTFRYDWDTTGMEKFECLCGMKSCSGLIGCKTKSKFQIKNI